MAFEEFYTDRYKVTALYPSCPFRIGAILHRFVEEGSPPRVYYAESEGNEKQVENINYLHIFQKLDWWEGRTRNDAMPFYMKNRYSGRTIAVQVHFSTPTQFWYFTDGEYNSDIVEKTPRELGNYRDYVPATEEEFTESETERKKVLMPSHPPKPEQRKNDK